MNTVSFKSHANKVTASLQLRWHFLNKASFFQLRAFLKVKNVFLSADLWRIIPAFISRRPDSCSSLYFGITQALLSRLLAQKAAVQPLTVKGGSTVDGERHTYTYSRFTNDSWLWAVGQSWTPKRSNKNMQTPTSWFRPLCTLFFITRSFLFGGEAGRKGLAGL